MSTPTVLPPISLSKTAKYPVTISDELLHPDRRRKRQRISTELNYIPASLSGPQKTLLKSSTGHDNLYKLQISPSSTSTPSETYTYTGTATTLSHGQGTLALFYTPSTSSFLLQKIDTQFTLNLTSTPANSDAQELAKEHPHISPPAPLGGKHGSDTNGGEDDLFSDSGADGVEGGDEEPDPNNPYDYRHFLRQQPHQGSASPEPSVRDSPVPSYSYTNSPHLSGASPLHTSSASRPRPKAKDRGLPKPRYLSPKIGQGGGTESETDELVIEYGDSDLKRTKPWRLELGILNDGGRNGGPISLRSAASSMSPSVRAEESEDEDEDEDEKEKSDEDVEEIDSGEAIVGAKEDEEGEGATGLGLGLDMGWDDDDEGDLEAELKQALEEQEGENGGETNVVVDVAESSSESEEE